jgi:hypothetical protein
MIKTLLLLLAVSSTFYFSSTPALEPQKKAYSVMDELMSILSVTPTNPTPLSLAEIKEMLHQEAPELNIAVINKVLTTLKCANERNVAHNDILTIIDYSLPSNDKRLWVFDLKEKKLRFHTYVSHGITSGTLSSKYFSNKNNSKASSIGVYKTDQVYYGRHGLSLKLDGLESGFNDNASNRSVVMHGGWYVDESFIKRYGRAGRSWGCPAIPENLKKDLIDTIKDNSLFVVYYPSDNWFVKSKFLSCNNLSATQNMTALQADIQPPKVENELRENILFAERNKNSQHEENEPIVVMAADSYERIFHTTPPLERMLRRQINNSEYIALSNKELGDIAVHYTQENSELNSIYFVIPEVKMVRGYYETQMKIVNLGRIKDISLNTSSAQPVDDIKSFTIHFVEKPPVTLKTTNHFIRWLGL